MPGLMRMNFVWTRPTEGCTDSSETPAMVMEASPSPQSVGREFVRQYYTLLNKAPAHLHRFYNNYSSFVHGGLDAPNRETLPVVGQKQIHNRIQQLNFRDCHAKISQPGNLTVHARFYNNYSSFVHGGLDAPNRETLPVVGQKQIHNRIQQLNFRDCHAKISQPGNLTVHARFYNNYSSFVHGGLDAPNRETLPVVGQKQIHNRIQQLNFRDCHAKISQVILAPGGRSEADPQPHTATQLPGLPCQDQPVHARFYNNYSSFVHGGLDAPNRETLPVVGQKQIHNRIQQLNFRDCHAKISQVDAQATLGNGVVVQVTGELSNGGAPMRRFTQTFVLAAQSPKKYYVHNDIFRYQVVPGADDRWRVSHYR
ncbi:nuclear transport factor 2 (NTF2) domain-containing protein [Phthorimaea operculella]|nr:nuclear transport factor 2 (NTF2) domain-containing protein [Phthorimaea operculella]